MQREPNLQRASMLKRNQVLHMPDSNWKQITGHLDRNRLLTEKIERERQYKKALEEESQRLRSNWDNSLKVKNHRRGCGLTRCNFTYRMLVMLTKNPTRKKKRIKLNYTYEFAKNRRKRGRSIWKKRKGPCITARRFQGN